jgi:hypothetical protein
VRTDRSNARATSVCCLRGKRHDKAFVLDRLKANDGTLASEMYVAMERGERLS